MRATDWPPTVAEMLDRASRLRRQARSLRVRTTAVAVLVVGIALVAAGGALVEGLERSLADQIETAAELRADDVAGSLESGGSARELAVGDDDELIVQILDADGTVVGSSENIAGRGRLADLTDGGSAEVASVIADEEQTYRVVAVEAEAPGTRLTVLAGRSTELVEESTGLVRTGLLGGVPFLLLLVGATTWIVVGRTLAPVEGMRREVDEISAQELHRRLPDPGTDDEVARLALTMNRMLERLESAQARQQRFVSDASHELRSPVATIRHHAEVSLAHPVHPSQADLAEIVLAEDERMERLVEDLLFLAQADEQTLPTNRRTLDLDDIVFDDIDRLRSTTELTVDVSAVSGGRVVGDPAHLRRVVRNLCDNATRHATTTVALSLRTGDDQVVLAVEDDGAGVPPEDRERIFERFVRLDEARARDDGGSGLGLAITAEIVTAHGGAIRVRSGHRGGARFEVTLPAAGGRT